MRHFKTMKWPSIAIFLLLGMLLLSACGKNEAQYNDADFVIADEAITIDFDNVADFEVDHFADGSYLAIDNGQYLIHSTNSEGTRYLLGKGSASSPHLKNVVISVATSVQSGADDNWFGVMCRLTAKDEGYAFLISADGFWAIAYSNGANLSFIQNWRETDLINQGHADNRIEARCIEDYLALYINGKFAGDAKDSRLKDVGAVGLVAGGVKTNAVDVAFDELTLREAAYKNRPNTPIPTDLPTATTTPAPSPIPLATLELAPLSPPAE